MSGMFILVHLENKVIISRLLGYIFTNVYTVGVVHILYKHPRGRGVCEMLIFSYVGEGKSTKCLCKKKRIKLLKLQEIIPIPIEPFQDYILCLLEPDTKN